MLIETISSLLEPYLENGRYFVVSIRVKPMRSSQHIIVLLDSDEGITIQECASISRRLANDLEAKEVIDTPYNLEVSSPGLDQPLVLDRQYRKNIGRDLRVNLNTGEVIEGKLTAVAGDAITIELPKPKKKSKEPLNEAEFVKTISLAEVSKALVQVRFS